MGYRFVDHTADVGIIAEGGTLAEAFEQAAVGMFAIITDESDIDVIEERTIALEASDIEQLLVDWLSELLFIHFTDDLVFGHFEVVLDPKRCRLKARAGGETYDLKKHGYGEEIKGVSYHELRVSAEPCEVQVIFDI